MKSYRMLKLENDLYKNVIERQVETLKKLTKQIHDLKEDKKELTAKVAKYENNYR